MPREDSEHSDCRSEQKSVCMHTCQIVEMRQSVPEYVLHFSYESSFTSNQDFSILYREQLKIANEYKHTKEYKNMSRTLLEQWHDIAYDEKADRGQLQRFWSTYFQIEKEIYEQLLASPDEEVKGTVKELAEKYGQEVLTMVGFLDGINDSLKEATTTIQINIFGGVTMIHNPKAVEKHLDMETEDANKISTVMPKFGISMRFGFDV